MSKKTWNNESFARLIESLTAISGIGEGVGAVGDDTMKCIMRLDPLNERVVYAPHFCNHPDMPDEAVTSYFILGFSGLAHLLRGNRCWNSVESLAREMCEKLGVRFLDEYAMEEYIRPVRRQIFPDPHHGGCRFRVGDVLRHHPGGGDPCRYIITDIGPLTDEGIMITFRHRDPKYDNGEQTLEEAEIARRFFVIEPAEKTEE